MFDMLLIRQVDKVKNKTTKEMISRIQFLGLSKEDIASRIETSVPSVHRWSKNTKPHNIFVKRIAILLHEVEARAEKEKGIKCRGRHEIHVGCGQQQ